MAKRPTISTIATGYYSREALNSNFQNIQEAFDNTLSLDGSTPNAMSGDLDMNGNALLNIGTLDADSFTLNGTAINNPASVLSWEGSWTTATAYSAYDVVFHNGSSYICLLAHTSDTFATDLAANNWGLLAQVGSSGSGSGDLVAANNLSDVANTTTSRTNLGAQAQSDILDDLAGLTQATDKIPYFDSATTASVLDFKDEDDMASNSASAVPSQQSVKAYVDDMVGSVAQVPTSGITQFPVGSYTVWYSGGFSATASLFDTINASVSSFKVMDTSGGGYTQKTINYGTWMYMGRIYNVTGALVCRIA